MKFLSFEILLPPTHSLFGTPYPWYIDPPTHDILTSLTMVYRPPYPWYIDPPTHGISNPPNHGISTPIDPYQ